eukprot:TRINITY_DN1756_c0_g1_i1.p1 TRINITY_DN1756_c0_g1~~TRINITY_DN1756_c0_g1_i1.p1  ORF type:complete len:183 (+),score=47.48 TRINITY_DN1756_c0_g1_i1:223-771(+)
MALALVAASVAAASALVISDLMNSTRLRTLLLASAVSCFTSTGPTSLYTVALGGNLSNSAATQAVVSTQSTGQAFRSWRKKAVAADEARERLSAQLSENSVVAAELDKLPPSATVYKLVGPVLVKQDTAEAKSNVRKRVEFIKSEITKAEAAATEAATKANAIRDAAVARRSAATTSTRRPS